MAQMKATPEQPGGAASDAVPRWKLEDAWARSSEFMPVRDIGEMRGFLAGIDTRLEREPDREP